MNELEKLKTLYNETNCMDIGLFPSVVYFEEPETYWYVMIIFKDCTIQTTGKYPTISEAIDEASEILNHKDE